MTSSPSRRDPAVRHRIVRVLCSARNVFEETIDTMGRNAVRMFALLLVASTLAGCDKCADYFIANPFAIKPAGTCQSGAVPAQK